MRVLAQKTEFFSSTTRRCSPFQRGHGQSSTSVVPAPKIRLDDDQQEIRLNSRHEVYRGEWPNDEAVGLSDWKAVDDITDEDSEWDEEYHDDDFDNSAKIFWPCE